MSDVSASVIVTTHNRAPSLRATLEALRGLLHRNHEVIVVNGPSTDDTEAVIQDYATELKVGRCSAPNINLSRNIGVRMAAGEVIAFIDDDAIPEPEWLDALTDAYDDPAVGAVGGMVYDDSGYNFQARYILCDRMGRPTLLDEDPSGLFNVPQSELVCAPMGTNSSYRRDALIAIGGFDEEYAYFLDETDVCARLVDAGYIVKFTEKAYVHHKFLGSARRTDRRVLFDRYELLKNHVYFSLINRPEHRSHEDVLRSLGPTLDKHTQEMRYLLENGDIEREQLDRFEGDLIRALREGLARGLSGRRRLGGFAGTPPPLKRRLVTAPAGGRLRICLLSQQYPPDVTGGIGRLTAALAEEVALAGHLVHVIAVGTGSSRVDLEKGVWVHRVALTGDIQKPPRGTPPVAEHHWSLSATMLKELERIDSHRQIDLVQAPLWDVEGIALLALGKWPVVTSLNSSFQTVLATKPAWKDDNRFMETISPKWIASERYVLERSSGILAHSQAIVQRLEEEHGVEIDADRIGQVPHGLPDRAAAQVPSLKTKQGVEMLFVGSLEDRKGIGMLLAVVPRLMSEYEQLRLIVVGNDALENERGRTVRAEFTSAHETEEWFDRVVFTGEIEEDALHRRYAECDLLVAPSAYESFGLVHVEAMMFGKPVVACRVGGVPEVVEDKRTGLLVAPNDPESLQASLRRLISDPTLREKLGKAGRKRFLERFTAKSMATQAIAYYRQVLAGESRSEAE